MPPKSEAQRRWAYASVAGKTDAPPSVGKKFLGHGITGLPARVHPTLTKEIGKKLLTRGK